MIIGTTDQNASLLHSDLFYQLKVLLAGTDPAGNFGELVSPLHTFINSISVLLAIQEKFTGTDHSVGATQFMQIVIDLYDLLCGIRCSRLLSVSEGSICDPDILWHVMRHDTIIKRYFWDFGIREHVTEHVRLLHIIQYVHMLFNLQKVVLRIHGDRTILKCITFSHWYTSLP